jgi:membrane associated rhomboid family serine protease
MKIYSSLLLVVICVSIYIIEIIHPGIVDLFILDKSLVYSQPYRIFTHVFIHSPYDVSHLLYNMFALGLFGLILEHTINTKRFLFIFFTGAIISAITGMIFYNRLLGSSGGIFAILGVLALIYPRAMVFVLGIPMPMIAAIFVWITLDLIGLFVPDNVAHISHLAGLFVGLIYGIKLRLKQRIKNPKKSDINKYSLSEKELEEWEKRWMSRNFI